MEGRSVNKYNIFMKQIEEMAEKEERPLQLAVGYYNGYTKTTTGAEQQRGNEATTQFLMGLI